jgi:ParB family transcriptional regulator, chromosome partitioning protein
MSAADVLDSMLDRSGVSLVELTLPIADIQVGDRVRQELGDVEGLAASIADVGLLQPPVVRSVEGQRFALVAGERRLAALRLLGHHTTRVVLAANLVSELAALKAEVAENTCRLDFSPAELHRAAQLLMPKAKEVAKGRQREHGGTAPGRPNTSSPGEEVSPSEAAAEVATALGTSKNTLRRVEQVYETAADPAAPEEARQVAETIVESWEAGEREAPAPKAAAEAVTATRRKAERQQLIDEAAAVRDEVSAVANEFDPSGPERLRRSAEMARLSKVRARVSQAFVEMQPEVIAAVSDDDELRAWRSFLVGLRRYGDELDRALTPRFRVVR